VLQNWCCMARLIFCGLCVPLSVCRPHAGGDHRGRCSCVVEPDVGAGGRSRTPPETHGSNLTGRNTNKRCGHLVKNTYKKHNTYFPAEGIVRFYLWHYLTTDHGIIFSNSPVTSAKEEMFSAWFVWPPADLWNNYWPFSHKTWSMEVAWAKEEPITFWWRC